jgi:hypothetical protein
MCSLVPISFVSFPIERPFFYLTKTSPYPSRDAPGEPLRRRSSFSQRTSKFFNCDSRFSSTRLALSKIVHKKTAGVNWTASLKTGHQLTLSAYGFLFMVSHSRPRQPGDRRAVHRAVASHRTTQPTSAMQVRRCHALSTPIPPQALRTRVSAV